MLRSDSWAEGWNSQNDAPYHLQWLVSNHFNVYYEGFSNKDYHKGVALNSCLHPQIYRGKNLISIITQTSSVH